VDRDIHDYSNTFRVYNRPAAESVMKHQPLYQSPVYMLEMLLLWKWSGHSITEIPAHYQERTYGKSKLSVRDLSKSILSVAHVVLTFFQ
jgi:hypothetical protein